MSKKYVTYYRVSTRKQERSGLGLDGQKSMVAGIVSDGEVVAEFVESESGTKANRRIVAQAIARARFEGATLVVAKVDRLARDAGFLYALKDSGLDFIAGDMPELNTLTLGILATVAQAESERIGDRQRAAKAEMRKQGRFLGGLPKGQAPKRAIAKSLELRREIAMSNEYSLRSKATVKLLLDEGKTLRQIAAWLTEIGERTPRGKNHTASSVSALIKMYDLKKGEKA